MINTDKIANFKNIPKTMREDRRWVVWRREWREAEQKSTIVPYNAEKLLGHIRERSEPRECRAASTRPGTWTDYETASACLVADGSIDGIGFVLGGGWHGIDLDNCFDGENFTPEAEADLNALNTYSEVSPSLKGVKAICRANVDRGHKKGGRESYGAGRFFTVTGRRLEQYPSDPQERQEEVIVFNRKYFPDEAKKERRTAGPTVALDLADDFVLNTAFGFANGDAIRGLWNADEQTAIKLGFVKADGSPDWSDVIPSLVWRLVFVSQDETQIDRLMRSSPVVTGCHWSAGKWDRLGAGLIEGALASMDSFYGWPGTPAPAPETYEHAPTAPAALPTPPAPYVFAPINWGQFMGTKYTMEWLIPGVLVKG